MEETRVLSRRGLRRGCHSDDFPLRDLAEAVHSGVKENIYLELDSGNQLTARGGIALAVCTSQLAPTLPLASALLCLESGARLRVRILTDTPPMHEMMLWFDEVLLAHLDMPFLTLRNITGKKTYTCHDCRTEFEHPNLLKVHLFLACHPFDPHVFWRRCIIKLQTALSITPVSPLPTLPITADPAQLEALAAAWGRSRDGHICLYCGKLYSRKYGLKIHIRTHTGYKPLRCRHCLRAFGDPSNLNKHVRLHASSSGSSEAHACSLCHKPLARKRDLLRHLRSHHPHALSAQSDT
ncbi:transcriptional repressor RHIT [Danaus plexippus]|uniref:transcriptional repressor RHIT n=1 Tax=Danaus plexippus TaxID=13037 RepID=UPI002AB2B8D0|nr:transcriptional repressor RHIT [Danaus plexippus]